MGKLKLIKGRILAIVVLFLLASCNITILATGAYFTSDDYGSAGATFGSIELASIGDPVTFYLADPSGDVLMPGDSFDIDFRVHNTGTAAMWVRFKVTFSGTAVPYISGTIDGQLSGTGYASGTSPLNTSYEYRTARLDPNVYDDLHFDFSIPSNTPPNAQGYTLNVNLSVESVQFANNGDVYTDAVWPT